MYNIDFTQKVVNNFFFTWALGAGLLVLDTTERSDVMIKNSMIKNSMIKNTVLTPHKDGINIIMQ